MLNTFARLKSNLYTRDFYRSSQYQISRKFRYWESRWYLRTDRGTHNWHDEGYRRSTRLYECAYKGVVINIHIYEAGSFPLTERVSTTAVVGWFTDRTWRNDCSGIPSRSHKCVIFIVQAQSTNVASGCMIEPGGSQV